MNQSDATNPFNFANLLTGSRLVLSPLFFLAFGVPRWLGAGYAPALYVMWGLYVVIELSDLFDGMVARAQGLVSDLGKLLDPFSDVIARVTYFYCLTLAGIMPVWFIMVVLYREFGIIFVRMLLFRRGIALGARSWGKLKSWFYSVAAALGIYLFSIEVLNVEAKWVTTTRSGVDIVATVVFATAAGLSLLSFVDYLRFAVPHLRKPAPLSPDE